MKKIVKKLAFCIFSAVLLLSGCGDAKPAEIPPESAVSEEPAATATELEALAERVGELETRVEALSEQAAELAAQRELLAAKAEYLTAQLSKTMRAPIDFNDFDMVSREVIWPLIPTGGIWFYSWPTVGDIKADDLVKIFCSNNYLGLPMDAEKCYLPQYASQPAGAVEREIMARFDVDADYLRTSGLYRAETGSYELIGGFGGGWCAVAMSARRQENNTVIGVGILRSLTEYEIKQQYPDGVPEGMLHPDGVVTLIGTLTVSTRADNSVEYVSYEYNGVDPWEK